MNHNKGTILILAVAVLLTGFFLYRDIQREKQMAALLTEALPSKDSEGRKIQDPYIENQVKNRIIKGYPELQQCYKKFLAENPYLTNGDVKMDWQVETNGRPTKPEVILSPFNSAGFHKCLAETIASWEFPEPAVKKYVVHTFKFEKKPDLRGFPIQ